MPTMGSLFAGIGGFDLGFERAGFKTVWQVEKNAYCRRVLRRHFPDADRRVTDVRFAGARNLLPVDVICGGFPCQDISNAGLRAGIDGARSGLWFHMHRIISELRPRYVVVENVAALLGRGMGRVLGDLSEIGYDAEWQVISASDVGAPHLRERIWITAYPNGNGCNPFNEREGRREREACGAVGAPSQLWSDSLRRPIRRAGRIAGDGIAVRGGAQDVAHASSGRLSEPQGWQVEQPGRTETIGSGEAMADAQRMRELQPQWLEQDEWGWPGYRSEDVADADSGDEYGRRSSMQVGRLGIAREVKDYGDAARAQWSIEPNVGRVAHGIPARVDRLRALGNAVVPQIPELIARRLKGVLGE